MSSALSRFAAGAGLAAASLAAALVAHGGIYASAAFGLAGDYRTHGHMTIVPVAGVALFAVTAVVLALLVHSIDCRRPGTITAVARDLLAAGRSRMAASVAACGAVTLWCMESIEQLASHGHLDGALSAFGAQPALGLALTVLAAILFAAAIRYVLSWLLAFGEGIVRVIMTMLGVAAPVAPFRNTRRYAPPSLIVALRLERSRGLRAPPALLA